MAICKCKMCGGDLLLTGIQTVAECEYCGTQQTVPSADSEKKMTLLNRANRLRLNSEFDRAATLYEQVAAEFPEESEAYWGLCLCNYGIEYVDDSATGTKKPTCHRASFTRLAQDENFLLAMEYADPSAQRVYREEAREIDRINEEILSVSRNETPYDIFICYKETDEYGGRTPDSVLAQEIYDTLTDMGYKVFFARISLEDKLGLQYEPYIFAALNTAKIMLVVGTRYEYFHAVWVKNEWNRFLRLAAKDRGKHLIPCYKDMSPYDMPEEFKALQAQDLNKLGAIQDLKRGIGKLLPRETEPAIPAAQPVTAGGSEKQRRMNGPDLIRAIQIVPALSAEPFPANPPSLYVDRNRFTHAAVQLLLRGPVGYTGNASVQITVFDALNNTVYKKTDTVRVSDPDERVGVSWALLDSLTGVPEPGNYRVEAWINNSRVAERAFAVTEPGSTPADGRDAFEKTLERELTEGLKNRHRMNGPQLIRTIHIVGTNSDTDFFPHNTPSNVIDRARYSCASLQIILLRGIGYTGKAKYNLRIFDPMGDLLMDETREIAVQPNYNKFAMIWYVRGSDGNTVELGKYRIEAWVDDSRVYEHVFQVIDSSQPAYAPQPAYSPAPQAPGAAPYVTYNNNDSNDLQSLLQKKARLEARIAQLQYYYQRNDRMQAQRILAQINEQIKRLTNG